MTAPERTARGGRTGTTHVPLRVLVVEDSEEDTLLLLRELKRGGYEPVHRRVDTPQAMEEALADATPWDVVLSDYRMPRFQAPEALAILRRQGYDVPFIVVSGRIGEDVAVEVMKAGAYDYVMKDNLTRLCATVKRGLEEAKERREHKRAEEALRASEASYRAIFDSSNDAIFVHDLETGAILDVNQKACELHGYSPEEFRRLNIGDFSAGEPHYTTENALSYIRKAAGGEPQVFEWLGKHRSGRLFWGEITLKRARIGGHDRLLANVRDITERKEAEEALRRAHDELEARVTERTAELVGTNAALQAEIAERKRAEAELQRREEHFRSLIENASDIITIMDGQGVILYQSPAAQRITGRSIEEMIGKSAFDYFHPDDVAPTVVTLAEVIGNPGTARAAEYRWRHKDGYYMIFESVGRTLLPDSAEAGIVVNTRDISERKQTEAALQAAKEEAERAREEAERSREEAEAANKAKSEFLSRMSHELRTPMNSILGFAQLLERKSPTPEQRKSVEHILKAGQHLLELINEVLDIARIESNRQQLSLEPVRVGGILQEALSLIQPLAAQHDCRIEDTIGAGSDYYVLADRQRLTQVLLNLLSNAVKYNRPGGSVQLSYEKVSGEPAAGETTPDGNHDGERLWIRVRDTGPGIPPEKMARLFAPFDRLGAEQTDVEGTGLGLALSERLVDAMGGILTVESVVGQGSTFAVALALVQSPLQRSQRSDRAADILDETAAPGRSSTLLYIEDNLTNLGLVEAILSERAGITLLSALQGRIGLDLALQHCPDLILLDLHLPDITGEEVLKRLRSQPRTRDIPVIIITADATPGHVERLMQAGASGYLTKPLDVEQFLETVDEVLREK